MSLKEKKQKAPKDKKENKQKKKNTNETTVKVTTLNQNQINIIGDNILFDNGTITAFYLLPLNNYSTNSGLGIENNIQRLKNMITSLTLNNPTIKFTIERIDKSIRYKDVINNLYDTIKLYRPDYEMPVEFTRNIGKNEQSYCMLGINLEQTDMVEVEDLTIKDTMKALLKNATNTFTGLGNNNIDVEQILRIEDNIYRAIRGTVLRADKDLVFYTYVSKVFPCHEISYDKLSYINENNYEAIMQNVTQSVIDNFGSFELHNEGVDIFGLEPVTTYGCILNVQRFPVAIDSINFPMDFPNVVTTIQCMKKEKATLNLKRTRAADRYERDQAIEADADIESIEAAQNSIDIATHAIQELEAGETMCEFNTSIIVFADNMQDLKKYIMSVVNTGKDRGMLITKSLTQALDFLQNYVGKRPRKLMHMAPVAFPLSFQQNSGATVGDDEEIWSPAIGEDIS